jgi:hypothetical protein
LVLPVLLEILVGLLVLLEQLAHLVHLEVRQGLLELLEFKVLLDVMEVLQVRPGLLDLQADLREQLDLLVHKAIPVVLLVLPVHRELLAQVD